MTLLLIIAAAIFTLVAAYQLVAPFLSSREDLLRFEVLDEDLRRVEELAARKSTLLQTLRDVEFDYETGKITEQDYKQLKRRYERQAVAVMRDLDSLHGGRGWEATIDEELARRLERHEQTAAEPMPANAPATDAPATVDCPSCGKEMEADARFCSQCGHNFASSEADSDEAKPPLESRSLPASGSKVAT